VTASTRASLAPPAERFAERPLELAVLRAPELVEARLVAPDAGFARDAEEREDDADLFAAVEPLETERFAAEDPLVVERFVVDRPVVRLAAEPELARPPRELEPGPSDPDPALLLGWGMFPPWWTWGGATAPYSAHITVENIAYQLAGYVYGSASSHMTADTTSTARATVSRRTFSGVSDIRW